MRTLAVLFFSLILFFFSGCARSSSEVVLQTEALEMAIDGSGKLTQLKDRSTGRQYLSDAVTSPLVQLKVQGKVQTPKSLKREADLLLLEFEDLLTLSIRVKEHATHLSFELIKCNRIEEIEWLAWGPFANTINQQIGETVGVVRGESFALGIQSLNIKTLGGYPWYDNDTTPQLDIFEQDDYSDLSEEGKRETLYRVEAAKPEPFGSSLQAYVRNRFNERVVSNLNHDYFVSPVYDDEGIIGSKIALFGVQVEKALETIGKIEIAESLPHPQIDGQWGKTAKGAAAAYLIYDFNEANIEQAIALTQQAGLKYLYHSDPFKNWGHFELKEEAFPNGWDGLKACVDKAAQSGIYVGVHTLSNFITPNDPYVTPKPDARLGIVGYSSLSANIDAIQTEIPIEAAEFFDQYANNNLKTVRIGKELIRYNSVSSQAPYKLIGCERGAWQTSAAAHESGQKVSKLADHAYKVFLTNPALTVEMAEKLSALYTYTGLRQISFDGLEGNRSTGMGNYGELLFTSSWYNSLTDELKSQLIIDASRTTHFFWHTYSRMNWGEPWYAGFRESQTEYRLKNQAYFERNMMPNMLGWFSLRSNTTLEDIEWMLARSAAYDAGYAFVVRDETLQQNGQLSAIFKRIADWEKLRITDAFSADQKERMKSIETEFELEYRDKEAYGIRQIHTMRFSHEAKIRQPGEPLYTSFSFDNPLSETDLFFILTAQGADAAHVVLELNNSKTIKLPVRLSKGQSLRYLSKGSAEIVDGNLTLIKRIPIDAHILKVSSGRQTIQIDAYFENAEEDASLKVELRLADKVEPLAINY
jgi:hypothetical protein